MGNRFTRVSDIVKIEVGRKKQRNNDVERKVQHGNGKMRSQSHVKEVAEQDIVNLIKYIKADPDGRGPTPPLTDWNVFPKRLAGSDDPDTRRFFSHWNTAMCEWAASDWSDEVRDMMPRGRF